MNFSGDRIYRGSPLLSSPLAGPPFFRESATLQRLLSLGKGREGPANGSPYF